jgi:hypothetical protein
MKNTAGPPVMDDDFFDREKEQRLMWNKLETNNLLLLAPRRVGKTSLMLKLKKDAPDHGYRCLFFSVEDVGDETVFVRKFYEKVCEVEGCEPILDRIFKSPIGKLIKRTKKISVSGVGLEFGELSKDDWTLMGKTLAHALSDFKEPWIIEIDELPLFILKLLKLEDGEKRVRAFLSWLRVLRQEHSEIRWILAGSIGLDTVTARLNMGDTINDLQSVHLGPFTEESARRLLKSLADSYHMVLSPSVQDDIVGRVGWLLPYYLQISFSLLRDNFPENEEKWEPAIELLPRIFEVLLSPAHRNYFDYWRQRLAEELGAPDDRHAVVLLNTACQDGEGVKRQTLFQSLNAKISDPDQCSDRLRYLLDVLVNDGYLVEDGDRYRFRFGLLREYWFRRVRA